MSPRVAFLVKLLGVVVFSLAAGIGSAWLTVQQGMRLGNVKNGPWSTNENIGAESAGAYLRAGVAVGGLLALSKAETVYYTAFEDSDGQPLRANCAYLVEGRDPEARWWSITAYGADHYLIPNEAKRYAVAKTNVERDGAGLFSIRAGGEAREKNWLSLGKGAEPISLTLRLYNPEPFVVEHLRDVELPRIRRESCR